VPRTRLIAFLPLAVVLMGVLACVALFAVESTAAQIALVIAILAVGLILSTAMLIAARRT
jgi:multisubunit Na+/H+ antiporter MnhF subunit